MRLSTAVLLALTHSSGGGRRIGAGPTTPRCRGNAVRLVGSAGCWGASGARGGRERVAASRSLRLGCWCLRHQGQGGSGGRVLVAVSRRVTVAAGRDRLGSSTSARSPGSGGRDRPVRIEPLEAAARSWRSFVVTRGRRQSVAGRDVAPPAAQHVGPHRLVEMSRSPRLWGPTLRTSVSVSMTAGTTGAGASQAHPPTPGDAARCSTAAGQAMVPRRSSPPRPPCAHPLGIVWFSRTSGDMPVVTPTGLAALGLKADNCHITAGTGGRGPYGQGA